jgi:hypothetical protein
MRRAQPSAGLEHGAAGYPIVATAFAGIELFGALGSKAFDP